MILKPGTADGEICCTVAPVALEDNPQYEALSYVWGIDDPRERISVNEDKNRMQPQDNRVRDNLFSALKALRDPEKSRSLWIDAI